jgi:hypothetical protein
MPRHLRQRVEDSERGFGVTPRDLDPSQSLRSRTEGRISKQDRIQFGLGFIELASDRERLGELVA